VYKGVRGSGSGRENEEEQPTVAFAKKNASRFSSQWLGTLERGRKVGGLL
jgi:hypothetical protein